MFTSSTPLPQIILPSVVASVITNIIINIIYGIIISLSHIHVTIVYKGWLEIAVL